MRRIPELLAPAGSLDILKGAVNAGADAVYFGGKAFNARAGAANFESDQIREAVCFCAPRGVRTYLTLNTLIKQTEWEELLRFVDEVLPLGISGLIMQDIGAAAYVRRRFPQIELSASTQMSIHNLEGAVWAQKAGFGRVVLSRELPLSEVREIRERAGIETEVFIHGALCYSYSGQCLLSSMIGGRSGNRGRCAQPCRLSYRTDLDPAERHYMNLKDICTIDHIKELAEHQVDSLKVEGRLKGLPYVQGVISAYRRALDYYREKGENIRLSDREREELALLFNRGGFSKGYLFGKTDDMICHDSPKHSGVHAGRVAMAGRRTVLELEEAVEPGDALEVRTSREPYPSVIVQARSWTPGQSGGGKLSVDPLPGARAGDEVRLLVRKSLSERLSQEMPERKIPVGVSARLRIGEAPVMTLTHQGIHAEYMGAAPVMAADKRPLSGADVRKQLAKFGDTPFTAEEITIQMDEGCFLPVSALNELRRGAAAEMLRRMEPPFYQPSEVPMPSVPDVPAGKQVLDAVITSEEQLAALGGRVERIYLRTEYFRPERIGRYQELAKGSGLALALPHITRREASDRLMADLKRWRAAGLDRLLAWHLGEILPHNGWIIETGPGVPVMSHLTRTVLQQGLWQDADALSAVMGVTLSPELSYNELAAIPFDPTSACIVYGRIPVMLTEQCPTRESGLCTRERPGATRRPELLIDRKHESWPMERHCRDCYNVFYLNRPIWLADHPRRLAGLPAGRLRLYFLDETPSRVEEILTAYTRALAGTPCTAEFPVTAGRYEKGVE